MVLVFQWLPLSNKWCFNYQKVKALRLEKKELQTTVKAQALLLSGRPPLLLYIPKGGQVAGLELVDIQPSVPGSRPVSAGPTV